MFKKFLLVLTNLVVIYFETYLLTIKAKRLVIIFLNLTIGSEQLMALLLGCLSVIYFNTLILSYECTSIIFD